MQILRGLPRRQRRWLDEAVNTSTQYHTSQADRKIMHFFLLNDAPSCCQNTAAKYVATYFSAMPRTPMQSMIMQIFQNGPLNRPKVVYPPV